MKIEKPVNENYCATVIRLKSITKLEGCDNLVGTPIFGFQAIVGKEHQSGDMGIVFPAETQLSDEFCRENNLYRHEDKNKDESHSKKGYLEDNRRVKAIKLRGHRSDALFLPLTSLSYLGIKIDDLKEGDEFDQLDGHEICKKYVTEQRGPRANHQAGPKVFKRVDTKFMPENLDTDNYFKWSDNIPEDTDVIVTQKLHGTSIRIANTIVLRKLNIFETIAILCGFNIQKTEFDYVFGSRRVIKDVNNPNQNHFYETDIWTQEGKKLEGTIPENFIVYAEVIGWTPTSQPIQKDYTYQMPVGTCALYVYRVAFVNNQGLVTDLSWDQLVEFCTQRGMKYVPELWRGKKKEFDPQQFLDKRLNDSYRHCLPLDKAELVDEGVCIRQDRLTPYILKAKSPIFLQHETKMLDEAAIDLETEGSLT